MVAAMWELMLDKGFTREQLDAKLDKIKEQKITLDPWYNMEKNDPAACDKARRDSMNEVISFLREWDISWLMNGSLRTAHISKSEVVKEEVEKNKASLEKSHSGKATELTA